MQSLVGCTVLFIEKDHYFHKQGSLIFLLFKVKQKSVMLPMKLNKSELLIANKDLWFQTTLLQEFGLRKIFNKNIGSKHCTV